MPMPKEKWDVKSWVITILLGLVMTFGGYSIRTITKDIEVSQAEVQRVKQLATDLEIRQAVDDVHFTEIRTGIDEVKSQVKDVRDLLIRTHMQELKKSKE